MKMISYFIDKKTGEQLSHSELEARYRLNFDTYTEFAEWRDENFEEHEKFIESPYERARNSVYATGNKWAIENFNSTHN